MNRRSFIKTTLGFAGAAWNPNKGRSLGMLKVLDNHAEQPLVDLVIYGATPSGVVTALAASQQGLRVVLLEPRNHVGGMMSSGLGWTDFWPSDKGVVIGGLAREFFARITHYYGSDAMREFNKRTGQQGLEDTGWYFEPSVAEKIFRLMLAEFGVVPLFGHRLQERNAVLKKGAKITEIRMENAKSIRGKMFVDATYEGDLMAQAGVTYSIGREARGLYGEVLAGVLVPDGGTDLKPVQDQRMIAGISAYDSNGKLLPGVYDGPRGSVGSADSCCQAYGFRVCLTKNRANQVHFVRPKDYSPAQFELLARVLKAMQGREGRVPNLERVLKNSPLPNGKTDTNNQGPFSTDFINASWKYAESDYATRERIWQDHIAYQKGLFYFLANDSRVAEKLRQEMNEWGLAKDEFKDTDNWPHQLYIREGRRMVGSYVMVQKDVQTEITKPDSIGMGSYAMDSHIVQRRANQQGTVENEGQIFTDRGAGPYQIPYRIITPKRSDADNLFVTVCVSSSHVAYQTLRLEPQYMITGHAAGVAAAMAVEGRIAIQDVDTASLQQRLRKEKAVLS